MLTDPEEILNFWFYEVGPARWFVPDPTVDGDVRARFLEAHERAALEGLREWEETPEGVLCLLLLLDMFPRRLFRATARVFATDGMALDLARQAIIRHFDDRIDRAFKLFFYLPFARAENVEDQRLSLFYIRERTKEPVWIAAAQKRLGLIERFGRFPQRHIVLGRVGTAEEESFLKDDAAQVADVFFDF